MDPHAEAAPDTDTENIYITDEEIRAIVAGYEQKYGLSSAEFLKRWKADTIEDVWETNDWSMLLSALGFDDAPHEEV